MTGTGRDEKTRELHKVYASDSRERTSEIYDGWSGDYERHMAAAGYTHPAMVASMLARHRPPGDEPVLDAGTCLDCGADAGRANPKAVRHSRRRQNIGQVVVTH